MNDYIYYYLLAVNILAFVLFGVDKQKARRNKWRIPEKTLILSAVIGGSVGAILGMRFFHHKTRKARFAIGVPVILLVQIGVVCLVQWAMKSNYEGNNYKCNNHKYNTCLKKTRQLSQDRGETNTPRLGSCYFFHKRMLKNSFLTNTFMMI